MELTLKKYLEFLNVHKFDFGNAQRNLRIMDKVLKLIDESNVKQFYPTNIFSKEFNQEFYFLLKRKL